MGRGGSGLCYIVQQVFNIVTMESPGELMPCPILSDIYRFGLIFIRIMGVGSFQYQLVCHIVSGHKLFEEFRTFIVKA